MFKHDYPLGNFELSGSKLTHIHGRIHIGTHIHTYTRNDPNQKYSNLYISSEINFLNSTTYWHNTVVNFRLYGSIPRNRICFSTRIHYREVSEQSGQESIKRRKKLKQYKHLVGFCGSAIIRYSAEERCRVAYKFRRWVFVLNFSGRITRRANAAEKERERKKKKKKRDII